LGMPAACKPLRLQRWRQSTRWKRCKRMSVLALDVRGCLAALPVVTGWGLAAYHPRGTAQAKPFEQHPGVCGGGCVWAMRARLLEVILASLNCWGLAWHGAGRLHAPGDSSGACAAGPGPTILRPPSTFPLVSGCVAHTHSLPQHKHNTPPTTLFQPPFLFRPWANPGYTQR
jgi:hypothetical protein